MSRKDRLYVKEEYSPFVAGEAKELAARGMRLQEIALYFGISREDLDRLYGQELRKAFDRANHDVANALFKVATNPRSKQQVSAAKFWLERRAGWSKPVDEGQPDPLEIHIHLPDV